MTTSSLFVCEESGFYRAATEQEITSAACESIYRDLQSLDVMNSPAKVKDFLRLKISTLGREVFGIMYLDAHNRLVAYEELFRGSLSQTMVYPREVVKGALKNHADGVILFHNHPGGTTKPSQADLKLTNMLRDALALVDVSIRDHVIVAHGGTSLSFAEEGLL